MATHQVFGQLETVVGGLPADYPGKDGYMLWIADARKKYAEPPTDVDEYIKGLKAAGTALRGKMAVPAVPVAAAAPAMAAVAAAPAVVAEAAPPESAPPPPPADKMVPPPTLLKNADGTLVGSTTPAPPPPESAPPPPPVDRMAPPPTLLTNADGTLVGSTTPVRPTQSDIDNASEALSSAEPGPEQDAARERLYAVKKAAGQEEGGKRKTHHQTPKRRRSAKGRKKLSKKKTGSRK